MDTREDIEQWFYRIHAVLRELIEEDFTTGKSRDVSTLWNIATERVGDIVAVQRHQAAMTEPEAGTEGSERGDPPVA